MRLYHRWKSFSLICSLDCWAAGLAMPLRGSISKVILSCSNFCLASSAALANSSSWIALLSLHSGQVLFAVGSPPCGEPGYNELWQVHANAGTGVSIVYKNGVSYKAWFKRFEISLVWPYALFYEMQVVFYKTFVGVDRHKLTVFYLKSFDMDSVQVGKAVFNNNLII